MKNLHIYIFTLILIFFGQFLHAQPPIRIVDGIIRINDKSVLYRESNYLKSMDSLDKKLKANPRDTSALFYRALFYTRSNDILNKPYQTDPKALSELNIAKTFVKRAFDFGRQDFLLKLLTAEIYASIAYRYTGDESWKLKAAEIAARRKAFNEAKEKANQYYEELARLDQNNAYDYQRRIVKGDYPIR